MSTTRAVTASVRAGIMADAQYRSSILITIWMTLMRVLIAVGMIHVVFEQAPEVNGWNRYQVAMVYGTFMIVGGIAMTIIFPSLSALIENIRRGTLDFTLTKPVDAQAVEATQRLEVTELIPVAGGVTMVIISAGYAQIDVSAGMLAALAAVSVAGFVILYAFLVIVATTAFWFVKLDMLMHQMHEMLNVTRWPTSMYPTWMAVAVSIVFPPAVAVTVPVEVLRGSADMQLVVATCAMAAGLAIAARVFWNIAVKRYSGASA